MPQEFGHPSSEQQGRFGGCRANDQRLDDEGGNGGRLMIDRVGAEEDPCQQQVLLPGGPHGPAAPVRSLKPAAVPGLPGTGHRLTLQSQRRRTPRGSVALTDAADASESGPRIDETTQRGVDGPQIPGGDERQRPPAVRGGQVKAVPGRLHLPSRRMPELKPLTRPGLLHPMGRWRFGQASPSPFPVRQRPHLNPAT